MHPTIENKRLESNLSSAYNRSLTIEYERDRIAANPERKAFLTKLLADYEVECNRLAARIDFLRYGNKPKA